LSSTAEAWFAARRWAPFALQREVWAAMAGGESGLLQATTGSGKTYAVWMRALAAVHTVVVDEWHELIASKRGVGPVGGARQPGRGHAHAGRPGAAPAQSAPFG
jgi:Lhr-like helicase